MARKLDVGIEIELDENGAIRQVKGLDKALSGLQPAAGKASKGLGDMGTILGGLGLAAVAKGIAEVGVAAIKMGGIVAFNALKTADSFNSMKLQLEALRGSSVKAEQDFGWIQTFTRDTPLQLEQSTAAFNKLLAFGIEPTTGAMQSLTDMSFKYGQGAETLDSAILSIGKAWGKGKIEAEEWNMLAERGIPIAKLLGEALGKTEAELIAMRTAGELGRDAIQALLETMGEDAAGVAADRMDTLGGKVTNVKDTMTIWLGEIGGGAAMEGAQEALDELIALLAQIEKSGAIEATSEALAGLTRTAGEFLRLLRTHAGDLSKFINAMNQLNPIGRDVTQLAQAYSLWAGKQRVVVKSNADLAEELEGVETWMDRLNEKTDEATQLTKEQIKELERLEKLRDKMNEKLNAAIDLYEELELIVETNRLAQERWAAGTARDIATVEKALEQYINDLDLAHELGPIEPPDASEFEDAFDSVGSSFADLLGKGFTGSLENFADLWNEIWTDLAKSMTGLLGAEFENWTKGVDAEGKPSDQGLFSRFQDVIKGNRTAAIVGGAGMMVSAYQQGGTGGIMQGMMGGAMGGAAIGLNPAVLAASGGMSAWIGPIVGAIIGGLAGYFGGGDDPNWTSVRYTGRGTFSAYGSGGNQEFGDPQRRVWERSMNALVRSSSLAYRSMLRLFNDPDLFDLVGVIEGTDFGRLEMSAQDLAKWISDVWLPDALDTAFGSAIKAGFQGLGLDEGQISNVLGGISLLPIADRLGALQDVIEALLMFNEALTTYGSGDALLGIIGKSPMEQFAEEMGEVRGSIDLVTAGWDQMSLIDRAAEVGTIGTMFEAALSTTLNLLKQIDQVRQQVNQSFDRLDEQLLISGMTPQRKQKYYQDQVKDLIARLQAGGFEDPMEVAQISGDIQRYIQALMGMQDPHSRTGERGMTWRNYLRDLLNQAQTAAGEQLDTMEDTVLGEYDLLIERMALARDELVGFADGLKRANTALAEGEEAAHERGYAEPTIIINIDGSIQPLIELIDARIDARSQGGQQAIS